MSAEILTKSRAALSGMFSGEQVQLGEDISSMRIEESETREIERELKDLPTEIVLYLQSMAHNFIDLTDELIFNLTESVKEKEAARRLWERFGLPKSSAAVPVFIGLNEDLNDAQDGVENRAQESEEFLARVVRAINEKVMLFYAMELNRLELEEAENANAISQLERTEARGSTTRGRVDQSVVVFSQEISDVEQERERILSSKSKWLEFVDGIRSSLQTVRSLEKPLDLGAPDLAVAL